MTYKELKDRLSKCELTLSKLKDSNTIGSTKDIKNKVQQLTLLKESLQIQLAEADKGVVYTDDEDTAKDLADDGANVKLTKEGEGVKFSVDETKAIAKSVGESVALAVKNLGDEIAHMKATNIEENSFDINIEYRNDNEDSFSFYIKEDSLHLQDFSFDKELTDVGVKPSGEAQVNVEHLANELTKHFKSMNEKVDSKDKPELKKLSKALSNSVKAHLDQKKSLDKAINTESEVSEAPDDMYYIKVKKTDKASQNALQDAVETFHHPVKFADIVDDDGAGNVIFYLHKRDYQEGMEDDIVGNGVQIVDTNMPLDETLPVGQKNVFHHIGIGYLKGFNREHSLTKDELEVLGKRIVKQLYKGNIEKAKAKFIKEADETDDYGRPHVDPKGSRTFLEPDEMLPHNRFKKMAQKEDTDVGHVDDEPDMLQATAYEIATYAAKLSKKLAKYDAHDGEVDFPNWWQAKLILAKDYMSKAYHYLDSEEKQPALDQLALESFIKEGRGDMDTIVNLINDRAAESGFSEAEEAEEVIEAIQDHYNLDMYGKMKGKEVGENLTYKEPKGIDKVAGGIPYRREGNKFIISMSLPDDVKERLLAKAKKNGFQAAPNQAGGITVIAKDNVNEVDEDRFVRAAFEDLEQVIRNLAHTANISEDEALEMAIGKLEAMLDGRDDMEEDNNPVPQGKHIKVDDMQFMHDQIVSRMKMLAKIYKEKGPEATVMLGPNNDREVKVVDTLKILTQKKRELEDALQNKVAGIGKDQELDEAGPGFKHDCAAKVVHEKYGKGNTIPEKHTLVKEGNKYVVTHYDVLFENGNTVLDIPVNELKIETTNEHWHKGYKKKKK